MERVVSGSNAEVASSDSSSAGRRRKRPGNADALLLPARQRRRIGFRLFRQADKLEQLGGARQAFGPGPAFDLERQRYIVFDRLGGQQVEMLEDHADAPAQRLQFALAEPADVAAFDEDLS